MRWHFPRARLDPVGNEQLLRLLLEQVESKYRNETTTAPRELPWSLKDPPPSRPLHARDGVDGMDEEAMEAAFQAMGQAGGSEANG